ncbi:unnamed protein product [Caenorhabditis sp. 36 PRJEB53466]|nr:unnamed protein product [Caenorhabditis sp. 36 PRJEB53466]
MDESNKPPPGDDVFKKPYPPGKFPKKRLTKKQKKEKLLKKAENLAVRWCRENVEMLSRSMFGNPIHPAQPYVRDPRDDIPGPSDRPSEPKQGIVSIEDYEDFYEDGDFKRHLLEDHGSGGLPAGGRTQRGVITIDDYEDIYEEEYGSNQYQLAGEFSEEEEDVDSDGPPDEEVEEVVRQLKMKEEQKKQLEQSKVGESPKKEATEMSQGNSLSTQLANSIPRISIRVLPHEGPIPETKDLTMEKYAIDRGHDDNLVRFLRFFLKAFVTERSRKWEFHDNHDVMNCVADIPQCLAQLVQMYECYKEERRDIPLQRNEIGRLGRFVLVVRRIPLGAERHIYVYDKRDPRYDPPILVDFVDRFTYESENNVTHPRANQYDSKPPYGGIAFLEDPFFRERLIPKPKECPWVWPNNWIEEPPEKPMSSATSGTPSSQLSSEAIVLHGIEKQEPLRSVQEETISN